MELPELLPLGTAPRDVRLLRPFEQLELLDILSSLGTSLGANSGESSEILKSVTIHLRQLLPFHTTAFFLVDPDSAEFVLRHCDPADRQLEVQRTVDAAIDDGTFAWAVHQNRPLFIHRDAPPATVILHSIATRSRHVGMFVGVVKEHRVHEQDLGMRLLSIILMQGAYALENSNLQLRIMRQNTELERMVRERTAQLEVALKAAQESAVVKSRFLANMSHEIRTPMNGILGLTELLEAGNISEEQRADLRTLRECGQNLMTILTDILDYSKIEAGKLVLENESFDLHYQLHDIQRLMRPLALNKGLQFNLTIEEGVPELVVGDQTRVRQVLLNLIGNAIKFTETGHVLLEVRPALAGDGKDRTITLRFDVTDTGIGISPDTLASLFQPFSQADASTTRVYGGTGLGLAISKSLCNLMAGEIWARSEPGRGSTFSFEIPFRLPSDGPERPAEIDRPVFDESLAETHPLRILVIDDSSMNQLIACRMLTRMGYTPALATGGAEGISVALCEQFDLLLIDLQMPDVDGYAVLNELRETLPLQRRPRMVAMTANALREDRERCLHAGFDNFLAKPFSSRDLKSILLETVPVENA